MFKKKAQEIIDKLEQVVDTKQLVQHVQKSIEEQAKELKKKVLLKDTKAKIKEFYKDENYAQIRAMIISDDAVINAELSNVGVAVQKPTSTLQALQQKYAGFAQPVVQTADSAQKLLGLNFFNLYKEAQIQKELKQKFSKDFFKDSTELAKYEEFVASVDALQTKIFALGSKKGIAGPLTNEIEKKKAEVKTYHDILALVK